MYQIYKYTNSVNGKVYIGQTSKTLEERALANGSNYRECRRFYDAIQEYSWSAFVPSVIEVVDTAEEANIKEQYYISLYNSTDPECGYNIALGGLSHKMADESRAIISQKAKERYKDPTANPMYGKKHSEKTLQLQRERKLSEKNPMYGRKWNENQRLLCGNRGKRLNLTDEQRALMSERMREIGQTVGLKPVRCIEDGREFPSCAAAAEAYGVSKSTLSGHLHGHQKTCKSMHFEYVS